METPSKRHHGGDPIVGLIHFHEPEDFLEIGSLSRANQAGAEYFPLNPQLPIFFAQIGSFHRRQAVSTTAFGVCLRSSCGSSVRWVQTLGPAHRGCARLDELELANSGG